MYVLEDSFSICFHGFAHIILECQVGMHFTSASGPRKLRLRRELRSHVDRLVDVLLV